MQDLKKRYKFFAINVAILIQQLPKSTINNAYANQLIRSSSSPGTNYRAACRAKSPADFINKLKILQEELDESIYFLELLQYFNPALNFELNKQIDEAGELLVITVAAIKTTRANNTKDK